MPIFFLLLSNLKYSSSKGHGKSMLSIYASIYTCDQTFFFTEMQQIRVMGMNDRHLSTVLHIACQIYISIDRLVTLIW
jgi:hypothetical protein